MVIVVLGWAKINIAIRRPSGRKTRQRAIQGKTGERRVPASLPFASLTECHRLRVRLGPGGDGRRVGPRLLTRLRIRAGPAARRRGLQPYHDEFPAGYADRRRLEENPLAEAACHVVPEQRLQRVLVRTKADELLNWLGTADWTAAKELPGLLRQIIEQFPELKASPALAMPLGDPKVTARGTGQAVQAEAQGNTRDASRWTARNSRSWPSNPARRSLTQ